MCDCTSGSGRSASAGSALYSASSCGARGQAGHSAGKGTCYVIKLKFSTFSHELNDCDQMRCRAETARDGDGIKPVACVAHAHKHTPLCGAPCPAHPRYGRKCCAFCRHLLPNTFTAPNTAPKKQRGRLPAPDPVSELHTYFPHAAQAPPLAETPSLAP